MLAAAAGMRTFLHMAANIYNISIERTKAPIAAYSIKLLSRR